MPFSMFWGLGAKLLSSGMVLLIASGALAFVVHSIKAGAVAKHEMANVRAAAKQERKIGKDLEKLAKQSEARLQETMAEVRSLEEQAELKIETLKQERTISGELAQCPKNCLLQ